MLIFNFRALCQKLSIFAPDSRIPAPSFLVKPSIHSRDIIGEQFSQILSIKRRTVLQKLIDLTSKSAVKNLLQTSGLRPQKRLGQNFLVDREVLGKIIETADLKAEDTVLEIGPGIGTLTQGLAKRAKKVMAVEKDQKICEILAKTLKDFKNVEIIQKDIRDLELGIRNFKIVANLPYYIVAPVIRKFLELSEVRPLSLTLMVQKEVGQRICAQPPDMSLLAVSVQAYADARIISFIPKTSFWPQPKVDGAIIKIIPNPKLSGSNPDSLFFRIVKAGFAQPRKQLANNLSRGLKINKKEVEVWLKKNNIQPTQRAETLNMENWLNLAKSFKID